MYAVPRNCNLRVHFNLKNCLNAVRLLRSASEYKSFSQVCLYIQYPIDKKLINSSHKKNHLSRPVYQKAPLVREAALFKSSTLGARGLVQVVMMCLLLNKIHSLIPHFLQPLSFFLALTITHFLFLSLSKSYRNLTDSIPSPLDSLACQLYHYLGPLIRKRTFAKSNNTTMNHVPTP